MSSDFEPQGEKLRKAVRWISDEKQANPAADVKRLVADAGLKFDLPPLDQEFLWNHFVRGDGA